MDNNIIGYCEYCKEEIKLGDKFTIKNDKKYHYNPNNINECCWFDNIEEDNI